MGYLFRFTFWLAVAACLILCFAGCAAMGALIGGGVGTLAGPAGTVGGAVAGAEAGDLIGGKKRAEAETKQRDEQIATLRSEIVELQATVRANQQIDNYNVKLPPGFRPVAHVAPVDPDEPSHWFRTALIVLLSLAGVGATWVFRARLLAWAKRLPDLVRGRAPSAPKPAPPLEPPPRATPLNPNP